MKQLAKHWCSEAGLTILRGHLWLHILVSIIYFSIGPSTSSLISRIKTAIACAGGCACVALVLVDGDEVAVALSFYMLVELMEQVGFLWEDILEAETGVRSGYSPATT